jgi:hypothetical protein
MKRLLPGLVCLLLCSCARPERDVELVNRCDELSKEVARLTEETEGLRAELKVQQTALPGWLKAHRDLEWKVSEMATKLKDADIRASGLDIKVSGLEGAISAASLSRGVSRAELNEVVGYGIGTPTVEQLAKRVQALEERR